MAFLHFAAPPDPIVTISKVQTAASASGPPGGTSLLKTSSTSSLPKSSSPASSLSRPITTSSTLNSLASILGQPRMSTAPLPPQQARFGLGPRPGSGGPGAGAPPPSIPRNSSPLMNSYRPPSSIGAATGPMMPNLHPRPLLGGHAMPPIAGPVSEQLNKVAGKLVDFMRGTLEELFKELSSQVFTTLFFLVAFI